VVLEDVDGAERRALAEVADFRAMRVLEVGCGDGRLTRVYGQEAASVLAIDTDADEIETARRARPAELAGRVEFRVQSALDLDEPSGDFDVVFFSWSL
jgi:2-polyprenyl-3-methyl-5-hydroxy-6-metoxy-1,4-benzoquinol methylase